MVYGPAHPSRPSSDDLRARIPGWGADLDSADRPSYPRERLDPDATGAHWVLPDQQPQKWPRERSIEHARLTPVFGTSTPPSGLSGAVRRLAYRYSEGRAAHWLLLIAADRVNAAEAHIASLATLHPDNPITETGVRSEFTHHGLASRTRTRRADLNHAWMDPFIIAGPWLAVSGIAALGARRSLRTIRRVLRR